MNRAKAKRWLNEYLDGEIGLADKAEFERMMAQDPDLRKEFEALRRIGLLMSSGPEVEVNPVSFRARLMERIEPQSRYNFTPQRAFAASMLVALLVVGLTFGQYIYSRAVEHNRGGITVAAPTQASSESSLYINASTAQFLNAILQRAESGMDRSTLQLIEQLELQSGLFEGAVCNRTSGTNSYSFPGGLPQEIHIRADAQSLLAVEAIAARYPGSGRPVVSMADGSQLSLQEYGLTHPRGRIDLRISFNGH